MAHWLNKIHVGAEWKRVYDGELTPQTLGKAVSEKLSDVHPSDWQLGDIRRSFLELPEDASFNDFDDVLTRLYNWGDEGHRLWIDTIEYPTD